MMPLPPPQVWSLAEHLPVLELSRTWAERPEAQQRAFPTRFLHSPVFSSTQVCVWGICTSRSLCGLDVYCQARMDGGHGVRRCELSTPYLAHASPGLMMVPPGSTKCNFALPDSIPLMVPAGSCQLRGLRAVARRPG